ncbi:putative ribonucleotide-diphosphate reductase subunit beta [Escherichia coli 83972]|nr:putative ribonucleotide-diphosphate reductase subunit beta [Escherichia coli 83972]
MNALSDLRFYSCVGLIRRASVASGNGCRMQRERLIRPTVLPLRRPDKTRWRRIRQRLSDAA